ncbi:unnamed protein product [Heligmosomoides polygyrus]|uniref:Plasmid stabilization protein n=1 Tax=Heligmosomoides polygyrus TaxID=6339 RepID=A0A183GGI8_HELPZ|nr:unnamed protein product [Heligmosomoides polygyrus]
MAPKSQTTGVKRITRSASLSQTNQAESTSLEGEDQFAGKSAAELIRMAIEVNTDPAVGHLLAAVARRIPVDFSEALESEKRSRSIVISGLEDTG